jgi:DNA-binding MarR family transcriptional regulator
MEALAERPDARQADLAARLGVAVGTVNWYLKRFAAMGYIKVKRINRWQWDYILTPKGMRELTRLTLSYVHSSMSLYRKIRERSRTVLHEVQRRGYAEVRLEGTGDVLDICRLTCLEQGIREVDTTADREVPVLRIEGKEINLELPVPNGRPRRDKRDGESGGKRALRMTNS